jgi:hypothetical protein
VLESSTTHLLKFYFSESLPSTMKFTPVKIDKNTCVSFFRAVNGTELYTPTVGMFNRCTRLYGRIHCANFDVDGFATHSSLFPNCWKAALFFVALGLAVMTITVMAALMGCCVQSIGRKSIFDLAGVGQSIAGTDQIMSFNMIFIKASRLSY